MSRMTTSSASFSLRESGDPACLFERSQSTQCSRETRTSTSPVKAALGDVLRQPPARPGGRAARPSGRARGSRTRKPDAARARRPGCAARSVARRVTRACGDPEPRELEHPLRLPPGREGGELVGADQEDRVVVAARFERVDGGAVLLELDGRLELGERERRQREPVRGGGLRALVRGVGDRRLTCRSSIPKALDSPVRASATWPTCGGSNASRRGGHRAASSLPASRPLLADLDLRALAGARGPQHRLELLALRRLADDPEAAVGAVDPVGAARRRLRPVLEELGQLRRLLEDGLRRRRTEPEERALELPRSRRRSRTRPGRRRRSARPRPGTPAARAAGRSCSARSPAAARRGPRRRAASSVSIVRKRSSTSSSEASITCRSSRARSRWARNSWPRPMPSLAPSIRPGTSATVSWAPSGDSTVPSTGASVVNG